MSTVIAHTSRGARRRMLVLAAAVLTGFVAVNVTARPTAAIGPAYGWPIKPFRAQHPVRGFFGDPRIDVKPWGIQRQFHFGIDISAPNGTPVFATMTGTARIDD